jgi:hypothetical protein
MLNLPHKQLRRNQMTVVKTSELTGPALDWAVALVENRIDKASLEPFRIIEGELHLRYCGAIQRATYGPSTEWAQGGPIIEQERLLLQPHGLSWKCSLGGLNWFKGPTPLIAAMRCYVASKLGDTVEIPNELGEMK